MAHAYYSSFVRLECLHDFCLVRAPQVSERAAVESHARKLGNRVLRIHISSAGQPDRQPYVQYRPAQNHPGDHHAGGLFRLFNLVFEAGHQVELRGGIFLYGRGGVLYF